MTITGNIFTASDVFDWFEFVVFSPIGTDHFINGCTVTDNTTVVFSGSTIDRIDGVNTSLGTFNYDKFKDIVFTGNSFDNVRIATQSPALVEMTQENLRSIWTVETAGKLPFGGKALGVDSVVPHGPLINGSSAEVSYMPWVATDEGDGSSVKLNFPEGVTGKVQCRVRVDIPN